MCIRKAISSDLPVLLEIESLCFTSDRISQRRFRAWLKNEHCVFLVVELEQHVAGYGLVIMRKGTRLARLYSLAIHPKFSGKGLARELMVALEKDTVAIGKLFMRLEVEKNNHRAIRLYQSLGYKVFGDYKNYYANNADALRMQKAIRHYANQGRNNPYPWYEQTTDFTCGPAALMMAMKSLHSDYPMDQQNELDLWREATTIFMMSGHGGCHPLGLALAATKRGFTVQVYINQALPLFTDGVRSHVKKQTLAVVEKQFSEKAKQQNINVITEDFGLEQLEHALASGARVLSLISTYKMDGYKVPHWVTITGIDSDCLYFHDPSVPEDHTHEFECQHIPVAKEDFLKLSSYGKNKLRTVVVLHD